MCIPLNQSRRTVPEYRDDERKKHKKERIGDPELQLFGIDRMLETLNKDTGASPGKILENVRTAVSTFVKDAEQFDDLTMLCVEYKGTKES